MGYVFLKAENQINISGFFSTFESYYKEDFLFDGETHDFWELMYIKKGNVRVSADDRVYELTEGEMIFHKPNEYHKFVKLGNEPLSFFVMSFSANGEGMKRFENKVFSLTRNQKYAFTNLMDFARQNNDMHKNVKIISYLAGDVSSDFLSVLKSMTELFLMHDLKNIEIPKPSLTTAEALIFRDAVNTMHKQIYESLSADDIARSCNVSSSYIKKIFKKHTGKGVHEYFLNLKIIEATKLLKEGKTVLETAETLSFCNSNYFSTVYKKVTGISPNKIKRNI